MVSGYALAYVQPRALRRRMPSAGPLEVRPSPIMLQREAGLIVSPPNRSLTVRAAGSRNEAETQ